MCHLEEVGILFFFFLSFALLSLKEAVIVQLTKQGVQSKGSML